ncbi:hypothetical protein EB105725_14_00040 [Shimwellia blattae DSM 4481 = NBRC 105725]|nr:hypothetical protein EB105725_14_00040 [Shimwellia blattae DSM 4481 = NBRC 105725]
MKNVVRPFYRYFKKKRLFILTNKLDLINKSSKVNINEMSNKLDDVIVSLTTHGQRIDTVHITIESILNGDFVPKRLILWLDNAQVYNNLPESLSRLKKRGVEIFLTKNYGPHTKYYPYIKLNLSEGYLVTADDDIIYPKNWLSLLYKYGNNKKGVIFCFRAHEIKFKETGEFDNYNLWKPCQTILPSVKYFATGVSGVIYPPEFQKMLYDEGEDFISKCPKADDVWLHYVAYKNDYKIQQIGKKSKHFPMVAGTEQYGLWNNNVALNDNDNQINKTYSKYEMHDILLRSNKK